LGYDGLPLSSPASGIYARSLCLLLHSQSPLQLGDAVAAILVLEDGRFLLQLRDDIPGIWYPGHWGLFGGSVDPGEDEIAALRRELREEIELELTEEAHLFTRFDFDLRPIGKGRYFRSYYHIPLPLATVSKLSLHEGAAMKAFSGEEALGLRLSPYDSFALLLYYRQIECGGGFKTQA
jgi:8-oxo-dGTP pyrophosphatase MutT (NUDIX family)